MRKGIDEYATMLGESTRALDRVWAAILSDNVGVDDAKFAALVRTAREESAALRERRREAVGRIVQPLLD
jgi:hypothetical protein